MGSRRVGHDEQLHFHFSLSCTGEGNGNLLQCSCLENLRDGGAWWAAVYGVTQSRTQLKRLSSSSSNCVLSGWISLLLPKLYCPVGSAGYRWHLRSVSKMEDIRVSVENVDCWRHHSCIRMLRLCLTLGWGSPKRRAFLMAWTVKNLPAMQETQLWSLGQGDPLEEGTATHSRILA